MTDIVEQLRAAYPNTIAQWEAADEIERLRAEIAELRKAQGEPVAYGMADTQLGRKHRMMMVRLDKGQDGCDIPLYTSAPSIPQGDPVAYLKISNISGERTLSFSEECQSQKLVPLYTSAPSIPEGWQLVPVEPTTEMVHAGMQEDWSEYMTDIYQAMLAAAPKYNT